MDVAVGLAILIAAFGIGFAMSRASKIRKEMPELGEQLKKPKRQSKREKRLEQIRAAEPEYVAPSIDDLIAEEVADTGVDRIPGGEGVAVAVLLKVFHRDTTAVETCAPEDRLFRLADGIDPAEAGVDDVELRCAAHPATGNDGAGEPD